MQRKVPVTVLPSSNVHLNVDPSKFSMARAEGLVLVEAVLVEAVAVAGEPEAASSAMVDGLRVVRVTNGRPRARHSCVPSRSDGN